MFDFEKLHKNQKMAFLDGFLTGMGIAAIAYLFWNESKELKQMMKEEKELEKNEEAQE